MRASKRGSTVHHWRLSAATVEGMPYREFCGVAAATKYWLKFSSPDSTVPHGVVPPEQLLKVPSTTVPLGSSLVLSRS